MVVWIRVEAVEMERRGGLEVCLGLSGRVHFSGPLSDLEVSKCSFPRA